MVSPPTYEQIENTGPGMKLAGGEVLPNLQVFGTNHKLFVHHRNKHVSATKYNGPETIKIFEQVEEAGVMPLLYPG